jgi:hypothetical protein
LAGEGGADVVIILNNAAVKTGESYEFPGGPAGETVIPMTFEGHLSQDPSEWTSDGLFELQYLADLVEAGYEPIDVPVEEEY